MKIVKSFLKNFLNTHFEQKKTSDPNEIRINSIYENDKKFHCYINLEKGVFTDFKVSLSGGVDKLISDFLDVPINQVGKVLIEEYLVRTPEGVEFTKKDIEKETVKLELPKGLKFFRDVKEGIIRDRAFNYLLKRKISEKKINELGYIYSGDSDFNERIFIPFYENGSIVYFLARDYVGSSLRYKNPVGLNSKEFVYNIDEIGDEVIICEGIFDAISLDEQVAVPMLSAHLGKRQIAKILDKAPKRIIMVPDNDETGEKTLQRNLDLLYEYKPPSLKLEVRVFKLPEKCKDLNDMKVKNNKNFIDFSECEKIKKKIHFVLKNKVIKV